MNNQIKKTWIYLGDELFTSFAQIFRYEIVAILIIIAQFALMELGIFLVNDKKEDGFVVYGIRLSLLFSAFCYAHANKACQSYIKSTYENKYRRRGSKNFWYGIVFFLLPACYLLASYLRK